MRWAGQFVPVPEVLEVGRDDDGSWLRTVALAGRSAVDPYWQRRPRLAVRAIGVGLRLLHDRLPVAGCPFSWTVETRVDWAAESERAALLRDAPPVDRLVVCHGDACAPNTLVDDHGEPTGHVDLVRLGAGDRWADLAVATYSLAWNFHRRVGARAAGRVRDRPGRGADRLLPPALGCGVSGRSRAALYPDAGARPTHWLRRPRAASAPGRRRRRSGRARARSPTPCRAARPGLGSGPHRRRRPGPWRGGAGPPAP